MKSQGNSWGKGRRGHPLSCSGDRDGPGSCHHPKDHRAERGPDSCHELAGGSPVRDVVSKVVPAIQLLPARRALAKMAPSRSASRSFTWFRELRAREARFSAAFLKSARMRVAPSRSAFSILGLLRFTPTKVTNFYNILDKIVLMESKNIILIFRG
jgi:hypothetical protein